LISREVQQQGRLMARVARVPEWDRVREAAEPRAATVDPLKYYAFLSYSHADAATADWLHDALEKFRTPSALAGRLTENGIIPRRLTPIFRDRHELPASDNLADGIREALDASRFLIVLCSPAAAASRWVNAEIDMFKRHRPDGCVLAAIVSGEPFASDMPGREAEECFPPALRQRYDRRGRPTSRHAEPLAADLRGERDGKRLGFLKLIAGMLGVGLDELVQRETLRRQRRLAMVAAASLAGMAVTTTLAITAIDARDAARDQRKEAEGLVGFMLGDLRSKLEPLGRLDVLDSVGARALAYYQKQDKSHLSDDSLAQRSKALTLMGEIANTRGNLDTALRLYREALAGTAEALKRSPDNPQRLFDHAQNVFWVGYIAWQRGHLDRAEAAFREYKRLAARMIALEPGKPEWRLERKYADTNLGAVLMEQHRYPEAAAAFQQSLATVEALAASDPANQDYNKGLLESLAWLADARAGEGRIEDALAQRERQIALVEQLIASNPGDAEYTRKAMTAHRAMSKLLLARGEVAPALQQARRAAENADALIRTEPGNTEWLEFAAGAHLDLGAWLRIAGDPASAATAIRAGCDIGSRLIAKDRSVRTWNEDLRLACLTERARLALTQSAPDEALALARQAHAVAMTSRGATPIDAALAQASAFQLEGDALAALGRRQEAHDAWLGAAAAWPKSVALPPWDLAQQAALMRKAGDLRGAQQIESRLDGMGYRRPDYLRNHATYGQG
jgi:tetratricopeptide (TPR) repeat protein